MTRIVRVTFQAGSGDETGRVTAELMSGNADAILPDPVSAVGAFCPTIQFGDRAWLIGRNRMRQTPDWSVVRLGESVFKTDPDPIHAFQLLTGLFIAATRPFHQLFQSEPDMDVVAVWNGFVDRSVPLWLGLAVRRVGIGGRICVLREDEAPEISSPAQASVFEDLKRKLDATGSVPGRTIPADVVRYIRGFKAEDRGQTTAARSYQELYYSQFSYVARKNELAPVGLDERLSLDLAPEAHGQLLHFRLWSAFDRLREGEVPWYVHAEPRAKPEYVGRDLFSVHLVGEISWDLAAEKTQTARAYELPLDELLRRARWGGIHQTIEIDRFGRLYVSYRDEDGRNIPLCLVAGDDRRARDRAYLRNVFFPEIEATIASEENMHLELSDEESLPEILSGTSFDGAPCEEFYADLDFLTRGSSHLDIREEDFDAILKQNLVNSRTVELNTLISRGAERWQQVQWETFSNYSEFELKSGGDFPAFVLEKAIAAFPEEMRSCREILTRYQKRRNHGHA